MKPLKRVSKTLERLSEHIARLANEIENTDVQQMPDAPDISQPADVAKSENFLRVEWLKLALSGAILLGLMLVNTGMLSQILRDLGVVPATMTFLGIPLAIVFAFILTLVEAGLGIAHGALREEYSEKLSLWPHTVLAFALLLSCVEGFFYSRVAPSGSPFTFPFIKYTIPQTDLFFLWGMILVLTLFLLGSIAYKAAAAILKGSDLTTFRREVRKTQKQLNQYERRLVSSKKVLEETKAALKLAEETIGGPATNSANVWQILTRLMDELQKLKETPPAWTRQKEENLTRSEVYQLADSAGLWLILSILGAVVLIKTGLYCFEAFYPSLPNGILWVFAIGQATVFFAVGFLLSLDVMVVKGEHDQRQVWSAPYYSHILAFGLGGLAVIVYLAVFFTLALPLSLGSLWFLNLLVGLLLSAAGKRLGPLLTLTRISWRQTWNTVVEFLENLWLLLVRVFQAVIAVIATIFYFLAIPLEKFFNSRRAYQEVLSTEVHSGDE